MARAVRPPGGHVVAPLGHGRPFRFLSVDGRDFYVAGTAWGQTEDQPHYAFVVPEVPDEDAKRAGWYVVSRTRYVAQTRSGRDPDENLAARDGFRKIGAIVTGQSAAGPLLRLPFEATAFDDRVADPIREARKWIVEKQERERAEFEATRRREAETHARRIAGLRRGTKVRVSIESMLPGWGVSIDGVFEEWDAQGDHAIVRLIPPGRKRRGLYRIPPTNVGIP